MKKKQAAIPRHIVVDTSTGEVLGVAKRSHTPVLAAVVLALDLVVCARKIDEIYGPGAYGGTDWLNGE